MTGHHQDHPLAHRAQELVESAHLIGEPPGGRGAATTVGPTSG